MKNKSKLMALIPIGTFGSLLGFSLATPDTAMGEYCFVQNSVAISCSACVQDISPPQIGYYQCDETNEECDLSDKHCGGDI